MRRLYSHVITLFVDFGAVHLNLNIQDEGDDVLGDGEIKHHLCEDLVSLKLRTWPLRQALRLCTYGAIDC